MIRLRTYPWFALTLALGCGANALVVDDDVPDDLLDAGSDARDAGSDVRDAPPEVDASIRTHLVTPSSDVVAFEPSAAVAVRSGQAASFTVTTSAAFEILVEGTCAAGTWTGGVYTTGPVTADCTVVFARGCDTCGGACVTYGTPDVWTSFGAFEVCANTCAITPRLAPACGTCDPKCGLGESCINGQCRCVAGPRRCTGMLAKPPCTRPGCLFTEGSELDPVAPIRHHFVEVDARKNEPLWLHLQFDGMFAGTTYPYVMECVAGAGEFRFPSGTSQAASFEADGTITNMTELELRTSVVRSCVPFEAAPPIYSFFSSVNVGGKGYYVKFTPNPGESGYAYNRLGVIVVPKPTENGPKLDLVQYRINVLADPGEDVTVTSSSASPFVVTPAGAQSLPHGSTPSFTIDRAGLAGDVNVRGTCPRGTWNGDVYTIDTPLQAGCSVSFERGVRLLWQPSAPWRTPTYHGGEGGSAFDETCPAGTAMVGLSGHHDGNIGTLTASCAPITVVAHGGVVSFEMGAVTLRGPHGESSDAPEFDARCPANAVVTRVDGYVDAESPGGGVTAGLHELSVYCSALTSTGTAVVLGPPELVRHVRSSWSMASSTPFSVTCPVGEAVMRVRGRAGGWLDGIGFGCGGLQAASW